MEKETIELVKRMIEDGNLSQEIAEKYCPELKENEDERIRKWLIRTLKALNNSPVQIDGAYEMMLPAIDWLEKQGEQKFEQKFFINDKVVHKATGKIWTIHHYLKDTNSYYVEDNDGLLHHYIESELKLVEQNWSEEDETILKAIILNLEECSKTCAIPSKEYVLKCIIWLKSLRPQNHWKPSEEQVEVLEHFVRSIGESGYASPYDNNTKLLYLLLEQLKKLREE